jgi:protein AroM
MPQPNAPRRVAFVTIGQTPRSDLVPEILASIAAPIEAAEFGALDGMDAAEIAALAPPPGEGSLATRLADGSEAVVAKRWAEQRLQQIFDRVDAEGFDLLVLLCTGHFPSLRSRTLMVEAQRVVDGFVDAMAVETCRLGIMVPLARQVEEWHVRGGSARDVRLTHFSPYAGDRLERASDDLADRDMIVMHCMGYDEAMRARVAARTTRPVVLARRVVAGAIAQLT